ncbi:MAG: LuxR family transcriptional regulator, maltose regulon positive regulatory protein [Candidatus Eremiobacteraeota bacterium]|nr:LuxR family transcriptional regulator, maltose regulon positive regulatory protein [Candidatus Eremiobacteraeota bacterium]
MRERVTERLRQAARHRVTLLAAPAGFGKSIAVAQFLDGLAEPSLRFNARAGAGGLVPFARGLAGILAGALGADRALLAATGEAAANADPDDLARALLRGLGEFPGIIALDNVSGKMLRDTAVCRFVAALVEGGSAARWIIGTRSAAGFPVASWMAHDASDVPVGTAELAFTEDEARRIISATGAADAARLDALFAWTRGWPTAFTLALRHRDVPAARRVVFEYLAEQVADDLDARELDVLLGVSPLPLIDLEVPASFAPVDRADLAGVLARVTPLVEHVSDAVYRCHPLFREYLVAQRRLRDADAYAAAAANAGSALLAARHYGEALLVFTDARDADALEWLLREHGAELIERGNTAAVAAAIRLLAERERAESPAILSLRATLSSYAADFGAAASFSERALAAAADPVERFHLAHRFALELVKRNAPGSIERLRRIVPALTASMNDAAVPAKARLEVLGTLALALTMLGDTDGARLRIGEAMEAVASSDDYRLRAAIYHQASYIAYLEGDAHKSMRYAKVATRLANEHKLYPLAARSYSVQYAVAMGIEDARERAVEALDGMFTAAKHAADRFLQVEALAGALDIHAERGNETEVAATLLRIETLDVGLEIQSTSVLPAKALTAAWHGDFRTAYDLVVRSAPDQPTPLRQAVRWSEIAVYAAAAGLRERALEAVDSAGAVVRAASAQSREDRQRSARASALTALALIVLGNTASANAILRELERSRRELSKSMRALLDAVRSVYLSVEIVSPDAIVRSLRELHAVGWGGVARLIENLHLERTSDASAMSQLTRAELDVLRALARGGSSTKVAADLGRSVNTVNVHVKSILRKLGCTSRHEALAIAREHGVVG